MGTFFSRERFGQPQVLAGLLLLAFVAECAWLVAHSAPSLVSPDEFVRVQQGIEQWHGRGIAGTPSLQRAAPAASLSQAEYDSDHSPLWYLIGSAPVAIL